MPSPSQPLWYHSSVNRGGSNATRRVPDRRARPSRLISTVLAALLLTAVAWASTRMTVRDSAGSSIGRIDDDGAVRNRTGSRIGSIEAPGTVRDRSGSSIGRVDSDGTIRGSSGSRSGRVDEDGTLRNQSGASIGRLDGCTVRNRSGSSCGRFDGCSSSDRLTMAAYLFFFDHLHEQ